MPNLDWTSIFKQFLQEQDPQYQFKSQLGLRQQELRDRQAQHRLQQQSQDRDYQFRLKQAEEANRLRLANEQQQGALLQAQGLFRAPKTDTVPGMLTGPVPVEPTTDFGGTPLVPRTLKERADDEIALQSMKSKAATKDRLARTQEALDLIAPYFAGRPEIFDQIKQYSAFSALGIPVPAGFGRTDTTITAPELALGAATPGPKQEAYKKAAELYSRMNPGQVASAGLATARTQEMSDADTGAQVGATISKVLAEKGLTRGTPEWDNNFDMALGELVANGHISRGAVPHAKSYGISNRAYPKTNEMEGLLKGLISGRPSAPGSAAPTQARPGAVKPGGKRPAPYVSLDQ